MRFPKLLESQLRPGEIDAVWLEMIQSNLGLTPAEALLIETWYSERGAEAPVEGGFTYIKTLATIRQRVALALYDHAREINWRRPVLFVSTMRLARAYLRDCLSNSDFIPVWALGDFRGRLGVATVLMSRFSCVAHRDAIEALRALARSLDEGNQPSAAVPYLLEAGALEADLSGSRAELEVVLDLATEFKRGSAPISAGWALAEIDARLRLLKLGSAANSLVLDRCVELLGTEDEGIAQEEVVHRDMLGVLIRQLRRQSPEELDATAFAHLRLPFGLRHELRSNLSPEYLEEIAGALRIRVRGGNGVAKAVLADVIEQGLGQLSPVAKRSALGEMIRLRDVVDERSNLLRWRDQLQLARLTRDTRLRNETIEHLLAYRQARATALLLVGKDLERNGPCLPASRTPANELYWDALTSGNSLVLYKAASEHARENPDLTEVPLGGRSDVTTVGDYYGLIGETFVFKTTHSSNLERERARVELIRKAIERDGLDGRFGVATQLEAAPCGESGKIVTVRRFLVGQSTHQAALAAERDDAVRLLGGIAEFLAVINCAESGFVPRVAGRKEMKRRVRRWFESIGASRDEASEIFDRWWALLSDRLFVRRDAHLDNWLVVAGRVVAIDLEAAGHTPLGYDLAQITDDSELLDPEDWSARRFILNAYRDALGDLWDPERGELSYEASVLARAAWKLSMPDPRAPSLIHAQRTMAHLAQSGSSGVRELAAELLQRWSSKRGVDELPLATELASGARTRISKAMAYHLRHGADVELDAAGWAQIDAVASAIGQPPQNVVAAAIHPAEKRFQLSGRRIRALYGHSREVFIERPNVRARPLVHGTSMGAAESILDGRQGLRPITRQWVHLSTSVPDALVAAQRHGAPLVLDVRPSSRAEVFEASVSTYLARRVLVERLTVRPLFCYWTYLEPTRQPLGREQSAPPA